MQLAQGMKEAIDIGATFRSDDEAAAYWSEGAASVPFEDLTLVGAAGQAQAARLYRGPSGGPVLIYIHGGGWAGGSIALNHASACGLAAHSGWNVLAISYRLAPQHPYPAGLDDCQAAFDWLTENGIDHGLSPDRIAVGGASAGANLAMALALRLPAGAFDGLLLFYGVLAADLGSATYETYKDGPGLTRARMADLFAMYDPEGHRNSDPLITPVLSDRLPEMPPTCLIAAEHDVLRADTEQMATRLRKAGVTTRLHTEPGVTHGFINRGRLVPAATACIRRAARFLSNLS